IEKIYQTLLGVERPVQLVVVCGKNEAAREGLAKLPVPTRHRAAILGFTNAMDELLSVAELVVSKPGGLTTAETLARGAVMVIMNPIPGQETRNSDYLLENGAAIKANNLPALSYKVGQLLSDPGRLARMKENVARIARPRAAFDVAARSLKFIKA